MAKRGLVNWRHIGREWHEQGAHMVEGSVYPADDGAISRIGGGWLCALAEASRFIGPTDKCKPVR
ncbi:hypothetical protein [Sphingomonas sp. Marseille-Q8236]